MRALAFVLLTGCAHMQAVRAQLAYVQSPTWHTMTAQHRVTVRVQLADRTDVRTLRGLVAVQRPDKLRLRALGPAGITLFDLVVHHGEPKVLSAIRQTQTLDDIIRSLARDLACAYALEPTYERSFAMSGDAIVVHEGERTVTLSRFAGTPATWRHALIQSPHYRVSVDVDSVELDRPLDPSLF